MNNLGKFFRRIALCAAAVCSVAVSCTDPYDDTEIREQLDDLINKVFELEQKMNSEIDALKALIEGKLLISDVSTDTNTGVTTVTLSNGKELQLLPKTDLSSCVTYITSGGVDYWAYIDKDGKKQYFLDENNEAIPVMAEMPEVITRDDETYLVIGGREYPLSGNSVFSDYELVADDAGNVYAVTFTFGENMSFTVTVDGAAGFMFVMSSGPMMPSVAIDDYFVACGETASVQIQSYGVVDYVLQIPDGWRVKEFEDILYGKSLSITAPSAELVKSGIAASEGELKAVAVLEGGKAVVAKLYITSEPFKEFDTAFGKATITMNNGLLKYAYGVCHEGTFDESTIFAKAVELMDKYSYPAGYGVTFENLTGVPFAEIAGEELVPGNKYVLWALPAYYDDVTGEYFLKEGTFVSKTFNYTTTKMEVVNRSSRDAKIDIAVKGAEAYYFGLVEKEYYNLDYLITELNVPGYHTPNTELIYSGSVFTLAGMTSEPSTEYVAWLAIAEEGKTYTASDIMICEFETQDLQPGSSVKVAASLEETSLDVTARITAAGGEMIYYSFLTDTEAKKYTDATTRAAYLFENGLYASAAEGVNVKASSFMSKMKPEMSLVLMALATDEEGKYSEVLYKECATTPLSYNDMKVAVEVSLNTPEEVRLNISTTGGEAAEYLYWIGKTSDNTWKSTNYLGGKAETAQEYMYLNSTASRFTDIARKYPVSDGIISITDHTPGIQYVIVIMAQDKNGLYSKATELKFTPLAKNIGTIVLDSDPKWKEAEPTIDWIEEIFVGAVGNGFGTYGLNLTIPAGYTAYVLLGTDYYFTNGEEPETFGPIPVEDKILTVMEWADSPRDSDKVVDEALYVEKGYPYGHEFYHYQHGNPAFGNAVIWSSKEFHDSQCECVEKDVEKTAWNGVKYIQHHVLCFNDGRTWRFENHQATGSKEEVIDRVFVVLQDKDGNCYQTYEWDVPVELFAK